VHGWKRAEKICYIFPIHNNVDAIFESEHNEMKTVARRAKDREIKRRAAKNGNFHYT
jgi:hypothetical protein